MLSADLGWCWEIVGVTLILSAWDSDLHVGGGKSFWFQPKPSMGAGDSHLLFFIDVETLST